MSREAEQEIRAMAQRAKCMRTMLAAFVDRLMRNKKTAPTRTPARVSRCSVLARQVDHVVGEIQCDFIQRKIGVLDLLGEHDIARASQSAQQLN
jgi:phage FluMu protein gp41